MKMTSNILKGLLLMGVALCSSCLDHEEDFYKDAAQLTIYLQTAAEQTRAYEGTQDASTAESEIKTIKVWLYDGEEYVGYSDQMTDGKIKITIPRSLVVKGKVDVYAIANAKNFLLETDLPPEKIARCCNLPLEQVITLKEELSHETVAVTN